MTNFMNPAFLNAACARPATQDPEEETTEQTPESPEEETQPEGE